MQFDTRYQIHHAAAVEGARYAVNGILVTADGHAVATDGHMLAVVPITMEDDEVPASGSVMPADAWKAAVTKPRYRRVPPRTKNGVIMTPAKPGAGRVVMNGKAEVHLGNDARETHPLLDVRFPDYLGVVPKEKHAFSVAFNVATLLALVKSIGEGKDAPMPHCVELRVIDSKSPIVVVPIDKANAARGYLMPISAK